MNARPLIEDPVVINRTEAITDWSEWDDRRARVVKIVIGALKQKDDAKITMADLPEDLAARFESLTHLHLWGIKGLKTLPALPLALKCLDVRECPDFEGVPELPAGLETLDFGDCPAVTLFPRQRLAGLRFLHLNGCVKISSLHLGCFIADCVALDELDLSGCKQLMELALPTQSKEPPKSNTPYHPSFPPERLKKVVLKGCSSLARLPDLSVYRWLHHLNLNECSALPELPPICIEPHLGLRYLVNHGCNALRQFGGLHVREVHLSRNAEDNAAGAFRTLERLKGTAATLMMSKVLLLGSGRCGKTTIAKALQWQDLDEDGRIKHSEIDPAIGQDSTHGVHFWPWQTGFELPGGKTERGIAHLWDFGGQEIYHNTHRLFASQGAVFVIAITSVTEHERRLDAELRGMTDASELDLLRKQNEYRELKYWLDYIRSVRSLKSTDDLKASAGKVAIHVVYTGSNDVAAATADLIQQAGAYGELLREGEIALSVIDFHNQGNVRPLHAWVKLQLGAAAEQLGYRVPEAYVKTAQRCDEIARQANKQTWVALKSAEKWEDLVAECAPPLTGDAATVVALRKEQAEAVARHLHECGRIFWLGRSLGVLNGDVIVDQRAIADLMYSLCKAEPAREVAKSSSGGFNRTILEEAMSANSVFVGLSDGAKEAFFEMLHLCKICLRIGDNHWVAVQRELLPDGQAAERVQKDAGLAWARLAAEHPGMVNHSFALHGNQGGLLGNSDYREVLAFVLGDGAGRFGEAMVPLREGEEWLVPINRGFYRTGERKEFFWRDGFMVVHKERIEGHEPKLFALQVSWAPRVDPATERRLYEGGLFVELLCRGQDEEVLGERLRSLLFMEDGPLALFANNYTITDRRPPDLSQEMLPKRRGEGAPGWNEQHAPTSGNRRYDVAISYRSTEEGVVQKLAKSLIQAGMDVYFYSDDRREVERQNGEYQSITSVYDCLKFARVLIVVASEGYFETPVYGPSGKGSVNLYCPVELAEAVCAHAGYTGDERKKWGIAEASRPDTHFVWLRVGLGITEITEKVPNYLKVYFENVTKKRVDPWAIEDHTQIDQRESAAVKAACRIGFKGFLDAVGRDHERSEACRVGDDAWIGKMVSRVRAALKAM